MSITAANAVVMLGVAGVFPIPQQLQGFAADDIFATETNEPVEILMGIDGIMSYGFVNVPVKWSISLQSDSPSNDVFDNWIAAQKTNQDAYPANATITLPSLGLKWVMTKGVITTYPPIPDAKKVLQPRKFTLTFESVDPAPYL